MPRRCGSTPLERFLVKNKYHNHSNLFRFLHWTELTNLSATCKFIRRIVDDYKASIWNVDTFLTFWFQQPIEFRAVLALAGALVTGSQVIQFFDGEYPLVDSDLDIVTRVGGVLPLILFLEDNDYEKEPLGGDLNKDGYTVTADVFAITSSTRFEERGRSNGVVEVMNYVKQRTPIDAEYEITVQIIVVTQSPVEHILMSYHSTGVMNFFTHREAISFFPYSTFISRVFYPSSRADLGFDWNPAWKWKYRERGFDVDFRKVSPRIRLGMRTVKDRHSWVIPFRDVDEGIKIEEKRAIYGPSDLEAFTVDLLWIAEDHYGRKIWRLAVYEPHIFWFLAPLYIRSES